MFVLQGVRYEIRADKEIRESKTHGGGARFGGWDRISGKILPSEGNPLALVGLVGKKLTLEMEDGLKLDFSLGTSVAAGASIQAQSGLYTSEDAT